MRNFGRQPPQTEQTSQVIQFRLRTGHNRLNAHMYSKFKVGESERCPCDTYMTAEQLLQHCQLHDPLRRDMWPEPIPLRIKLYGNLEELRPTTNFMRATGISVLRKQKKKLGQCSVSSNAQHCVMQFTD